MNHIAEITTPDQSIALFTFDPNDRKDVEELEEILGELADEGLISRLEFHTSQ